MPPDEGFLVPILVSGLGRSGTTLLMQLLGADKRCVFDKIHPLESRYLSMIALFASQWSGWSFKQYGSGKHIAETVVGGNPISLREGADAADLISIPEAKTMFLDLWRRFGESVRAARPDAAFYAEKVVEWVPPFVSQFLNTHPLYLFRDPRDVFLSTNHFNEKRGYPAFNRKLNDSDAEYAVTLAWRYLRRYDNYKLFKETGGNCSHVRYEDLVRNPHAALSDLIQHTGIQPGSMADCAFDAKHGTSRSLNDSIERWKREHISREPLEVLEDLLHEPLMDLGYESTRTTKSNTGNDLIDSASTRSNIVGIENGKQVGFDESGLEIECHSNYFHVLLDLTNLATPTIKEIWVFLTGNFGNSCELSWCDPARDVEQGRVLRTQYDPGAHCTTLRFKVSESERWQVKPSSLRLTVIHNGLEVGAPRRCNIRRVKFIPAV